ncbi:MAG TPA: tol-pal system protein YbgF, partial [Hyphomicrobiaceae bacterium]|nr:tol-pal system protein YbgF [Hyphomicrobiaceae bacterium]
GPARAPQAVLPPPVASAQGTQIAPGVQGVPDNDPIGRIIGGGQARANSAIVGGGGETTALPSDASPKQAYETAYGHLLSQDYSSAEAAFEEFLKRFPNDPLAGNAQYWLGETFFVRGQFRPAAAAFLKGYQTYARSAKAPDSLLKLGLSLDRLGQKDAACASFGEIASKFPTAPGHIRQRADGERRRLGCG